METERYLFTRKTTKPEDFHNDVYTALELSANPCGAVKMVV